MLYLDIFPDNCVVSWAGNIIFRNLVIDVLPGKSCGEYIAVALSPYTYIPQKNVELKIYAKDASGIYRFLDGQITNNLGIAVFHTEDNVHRVKIHYASRGSADIQGEIQVNLPRDSCNSYHYTHVSVRTDRPIYAPGHRILYRGYVWNYRPGNVTPAENKRVKITLIDPNGDEIASGVATTNEYGIYYGEIEIPMNVDEGEFVLSVGCDGSFSYKSIKIQFFERREIKAKIDTDKQKYQHGETIRGNVSASYYFGSPVAAGSVRITGWWAISSLSYPGYRPLPIYRGVASAGPYPEYYSYNTDHTKYLHFIKLEKAFSIEKKLDKDGMVYFEYNIDKLKGTYLLIDAEVRDESGRSFNTTHVLAMGYVVNPELSVEREGSGLEIELKINDNCPKEIIKTTDLEIICARDNMEIETLYNHSFNGFKKRLYLEMPVDCVAYRVRAWITDVYSRRTYDEKSGVVIDIEDKIEIDIASGIIDIDLGQVEEKGFRLYGWALTWPDSWRYMSTRPYHFLNAQKLPEKIKELRIPIQQFPPGKYALKLFFLQGKSFSEQKDALISSIVVKNFTVGVAPVLDVSGDMENRSAVFSYHIRAERRSIVYELLYHNLKLKRIWINYAYPDVINTRKIDTSDLPPGVLDYLVFVRTPLGE